MYMFMGNVLNGMEIAPGLGLAGTGDERKARGEAIAAPMALSRFLRVIFISASPVIPT